MVPAGSVYPAAETELRTALFVDFDNIFIELKKAMGRDVAHLFATDPDRWLRWLEQGGSGQPASNRAVRRRILMRNCYLNPQIPEIAGYRKYFAAEAFRVVDCPSLTSQGKSSADVFMVMDILDALSHPTRFDEFILFSGDTDFTPVMLRLRAHDRRTVALSIGQPARSYIAASDWLIEDDEFVESALGVAAEPEAAPEELPALLAAIGERLCAEARALQGSISAAALSKIYREFPAFRQSDNWLGFWSLRSLTEGVVSSRQDLRITGQGMAWQVELVEATAPAPQVPDRDGISTTRPREDIVAFLNDLVQRSDRAVDMAYAGAQVLREFGEEVKRTGWLGAGSFGNLLRGAPGVGFAVAQGYLYDPKRHILQDEFAEEDPELRELSWEVHQITGAPRLTPAQYAAVFEAAADHVGENLSFYQLNMTSKAVRDRCDAQGHRISRSDINFILRGISLTDQGFSRPEDVPYAVALGEAFKQNVLSLCRRNQLDLSDDDLTKVDRWIMGGLGGGPGMPAQAPGTMGPGPS
jgi:hypothetical protein